MPVKEYDVLIVGAGTAGATAAWKSAERGLKTLLVDQRGRDKTGACWVNGIESRLFKRLGIDAAKPPGFVGEPSVVHLLSPGAVRVTVSDVPTYDIEMRGLTEDLLRRAEKAGADLAFNRPFHDVLIEHGRVSGVRLASNGAPDTIRAAVTVDASGISGVVRSRLPSSLWERESFSETDICIANRQTYELRDVAAARALMERNKVRPGERLVWSGVRGGYSVLDVSLELERDEVSILTGAMRWSQGPHAATEIMEEGINRLGFVGPRKSGGAGPIPIRRAFDQLVGNGFALVGDAAGQVFPAHGSGVAAGMLAADILARTIAQALALGTVDMAGLWPYAAEYQRTRGALCASYEWVRRLSEAANPKQMDRMFSSGMIDPEASVRALACRSFKLSPQQAVAAGRTAFVSPTLSRRVASASLRAGLTLRHYRQYPDRWHPRRFARWRKFAHRLFDRTLT